MEAEESSKSEVELGQVHTTTKKISKQRIHTETHQMSSVHTIPEKSENATTTGHFGFVVEENTFKEITRLS